MYHFHKGVYHLYYYNVHPRYWPTKVINFKALVSAHLVHINHGIGAVTHKLLSTFKVGSTLGTNN
jgi:hypothetical protein